VSDREELRDRIAALESDRRQIVEEAQREADAMFAQYQLSQLLATGAGLQELAGMVLVELMRLAEASSGAIWFQGNDGRSPETGCFPWAACERRGTRAGEQRPGHRRGVPARARLDGPRAG